MTNHVLYSLLSLGTVKANFAHGEWFYLILENIS